MFIFIWKYVGDLTQNYHSGGGCAIVSQDLKAARKYARQFTTNEKKRDAYEEDYDEALKPKGGIEERCPIFTKDPDDTYELVGDHEEKLFIFPDAGCC